MHNAVAVGLDHMSVIEPAIASLIRADEALRWVTRCPRPQCTITDGLLVRAYDSRTCVGCVENSCPHLMLALSASLQESYISGGNVITSPHVTLHLRHLAIGPESDDVYYSLQSTPGLAIAGISPAEVWSP